MKKIILLISFLTLGVSTRALCGDSSDTLLKIIYVDVGQGDGIIIKTPNRKFFVVDGGGDYYSKLIPYLMNEKAEEIEAVIITHPHSDHIGGLKKIIETFNVKKVYDSGKAHPTRTYLKLLETIYQKGIDYIKPTAGETVRWDTGVTATFLHPGAKQYKKINNNSVVFLLQYRKKRFLFTGDLEKRGEREVLKKYRKYLGADVLKVGHHGSKSSSSKEFLEAVSPKIAVISCGRNNHYGHPHKKTLETLNEMRIDIHRTDLEGTITITSDGYFLKK